MDSEIYQAILANRETEGVKELLLELARACQVWMDASHETFGLTPVTSDERAVQQAESLQRLNSEQRIMSVVARLTDRGVELRFHRMPSLCVSVVSAMDDHLVA